MKLTFWGAARTVTGSMHQVDAAGKRILLDCGLYQGRRQEAFERNSQFPFAPSSMDAVILSHAHIDHSGNLPTLGQKGFGGAHLRHARNGGPMFGHAGRFCLFAGKGRRVRQ